MTALAEIKNPDALWAKWIKLLVAILLIPWLSWMSLKVITNDKKIAVIEANRFTSQDGLALYQALAGKADKSDVPSAAVVATALDDLKMEIHELRRLMTGHVQYHLERDP